MPVDQRRTFNDPIGSAFLFKPAIVAYPFLHFTVFIFSSCNTEYFFAFVPQPNLAGAFRAIAVGVDGIDVPDAAFESEGFVSERAHGANVDHVAAHLIVDGICDVR